MATKDSKQGPRPLGRKPTTASKTSKPRQPRVKSTPAEQMTSGMLFDELQLILAEERSPDALKRGLQALDRAFGARSIFASVHEPAFDRLNVALVRGRADPRVKVAAPGVGAIGKAFSDEQPVVERGGAWVAIPMIPRGKAVGVITLAGANFTGEGGGPSHDELAVLHAVANACGAAVEMGRARAELDQRSRDLLQATERLGEGDRTRDALLSHLSHELRTPLTTIKGYLSMGLKGRLGELSEKQQNVFGICDRNADRLLRLINDLLLTARLESGKMTLDPKALGLRSVVTEAIQFLQGDAELAKVNLEVSAPAGEVYIRGNRDRLVEGFMHLLERGLRGKRDGERIEIRLEPRGRIGAVALTLEGITLPQGELPRLFEAFRVDGGPANLGLSIARQIFELHGGHVRAEQPEGELIFQVALPLFAGAVIDEASRPKPSQGEILVVEDDDDCRNGITDYLGAEGFSVRAFSDGRAALQRIQEEPPALVLLDLRMPGVDGAALIKAVREGRPRTQQTPIYVISGAIDAGAGADQAWGERVDGVFEKPINFPYLLERVRELVRTA